MTISRITAYKVLYKCFNDNAYSNIALSAEFSKGELSLADRALVTQLVYGTISRARTLEYYVSTLSSKPISKLDLKVLLILYMSLYQIVFMDKIPQSAACDEAVKLAKKFVNVGASGFVNAIIRNFLRKKDDIVLPDKPEIKYSVSDDVADIFLKQYPLEAADILQHSFDNNYIFATVNTLKTTADELACKIGATKINETTIKMKNTAFSNTKEFENGLYFIQNISSAQAVEMLNPVQDDFVIDVCSAPGGKSMKAAVMMKNKGKVLSCDIHENKLSLISNSAKRLGISIIDTKCADGTVFDKTLCNTADKIICDVPCSGLGVISKKPEIRYKSYDEIKQLYPIQQAILENASQYLKVGGKMIYSTCTINKYENEKQVEKFLKKNSNYNLIDEKTIIPLQGNDGFYIALLEKTED